jgi:hypothetical protein
MIMVPRLKCMIISARLANLITVIWSSEVAEQSLLDIIRLRMVTLSNFHNQRLLKC